jgi:predicted metal-dependent phosphoesterase TrpH
MKIDLHCHSYYSDGLFSPEKLIERAVLSGVDMLALTDHDTTAGLAELHTAAQLHSINIVNGIELSVRWKMQDMHIIGLNIDPNHSAMIELIQRQNESRVERAKQIGQRLVGVNVTNAYEKACLIAGHERVGRPHFAQVLIQERVAHDMSSAFKRYLVKGRIGFVPTIWASLDEAVQTIVQVGGQAVIAHPLKYKMTRSKLINCIEQFKEAGGVGIEVVSGTMTAQEIKNVSDICIRSHLLASSGSDYHGDSLSRIGLGRQQKLPEGCIPIWETWTKE